jgi:hypothetical protein
VEATVGLRPGAVKIAFRCRLPRTRHWGRAEYAAVSVVSALHWLTLDTVISTMWQTAQDVNVKYKETAEGGLALQIAVNVTEC